VDGRLLVHDLHRPDHVGPVEEDIRQCPAAVTGDPGDDRDALPDEIFDDDLGSGQQTGLGHARSASRDSWRAIR